MKEKNTQEVQASSSAINKNICKPNRVKLQGVNRKISSEKKPLLKELAILRLMVTSQGDQRKEKKKRKERQHINVLKQTLTRPNKQSLRILSYFLGRKSFIYILPNYFLSSLSWANYILSKFFCSSSVPIKEAIKVG